MPSSKERDIREPTLEVDPKREGVGREERGQRGRDDGEEAEDGEDSVAAAKWPVERVGRVARGLRDEDCEAVGAGFEVWMRGGCGLFGLGEGDGARDVLRAGVEDTETHGGRGKGV